VFVLVCLCVRVGVGVRVIMIVSFVFMLVLVHVWVAFSFGLAVPSFLRLLEEACCECDGKYTSHAKVCRCCIFLLLPHLGRQWDIVVLTQNYLQCLLTLMTTQEDERVSEPVIASPTASSNEGVAEETPAYPNHAATATSPLAASSADTDSEKSPQQQPQQPTAKVGSLLIHCVSGWDRTPLFVSLIRILLWADGLIHTSLNTEQVC
jgi:hypothetical protein